MKGDDEELVTLDPTAAAEDEADGTTTPFPTEDPEAADPIVGVGGPDAGAVEGRLDPWLGMGGVNMLKG